MLENGDLIFVKDDSDIGQAIQESTGHYSHVAIFLDGFVYHASGEVGVIYQKPIDFFEPDYLYDIYCYAKLNHKEVKRLAESFLGAPYNASFHPDGDGFYCSQFVAEILPIFSSSSSINLILGTIYGAKISTCFKKMASPRC